MTTLQEFASHLRELVMQSVGEHGCTPISLSGGIDSASILAAQIAHGYKPELYTFQLGEMVSRDLSTATAMAKHFGLNLHVAKIPQNEETLISDIYKILPYTWEYFNKVRQMIPDNVEPLYKVPIQCLHAMSYSLELAASHGVTKLMTGFCADSYYGSGRRSNVILQQDGYKAWDDYRKKYLVHPINADLLVKAYANDIHGIDLHDGWADDRIAEFMFQFNQAQLNTPFPKAMAVYAFPEFWKAGNWRRGNESLQVVGGIREWHDTLLASPINTGGYKAIIGLYNNMAKELGLMS